MPLMATLGIDLEWWPEYASNLVFELWEEAPSSGNYLVRVLHNRKEVPLGPKHGASPSMGPVPVCYRLPNLIM
jgi:hypothetical protein